MSFFFLVFLLSDIMLFVTASVKRHCWVAKSHTGPVNVSDTRALLFRIVLYIIIQNVFV